MKVIAIPSEWNGAWELPGDWVDDASCARTGYPEAWFPDLDGTGNVDYATVRMAKRICLDCPVRQACLDYALRHEVGSYRFGIYGGLTPGQRYRLSRRRHLDAQQNRQNRSGRAAAC